MLPYIFPYFCLLLHSTPSSYPSFFLPSLPVSSSSPTFPPFHFLLCSHFFLLSIPSTLNLLSLSSSNLPSLLPFHFPPPSSPFLSHIICSFTFFINTFSPFIQPPFHPGSILYLNSFPRSPLLSPIYPPFHPFLCICFIISCLFIHFHFHSLIHISQCLPLYLLEFPNGDHSSKHP